MKYFNNGWVNGLVGVMIFAGSLPATRVAVLEFSPTFLTAARAAIAGLFAVLLLVLLQQQLPKRVDWLPLFYVAIGVVVGFPLFTALALQYVSAAHSIVFIGLLPLATAIFGVVRGGEKPSQKFWFFAILGAALVFGYMLVQPRVGYFIMVTFTWCWRFYFVALAMLKGTAFKAFRRLASNLLGTTFNSTCNAMDLMVIYAKQFC